MSDEFVFAPAKRENVGLLIGLVARPVPARPRRRWSLRPACRPPVR